MVMLGIQKDSADLSIHKSIFDIDFPIFAITKNYRNIWEEEKVTYIETDSGVYVLDNKNIQGNTLGQRRLRIKNSKLYIPRIVVHSIPQLIKSEYKTFIDNNGILFKYFKSATAPLEYHKVDRVARTDKGCVLHFKSINNPILIPCRYAFGIEYVGFLVTKMGYILYEYSETFKGNTWRKI